MIIQKRDGSLTETVPHWQRSDDDRLYVEVEPDDLDKQANLVARLIAMAFDVLGARHLEVRVRSDD